MKRKWLKVLMLAMMACASFGSLINPKEVEDLMHIMNQTRIEFTLPDEDDEGKGLGGQFKSGQLGSVQNRPTEVARNC